MSPRRRQRRRAVTRVCGVWTCGVVLALVPALARAQAVGPSSATARDSVPRERTRPVWRLGLEAGSAHEQDVRFIGDGADDTFHRAGGTLSGGFANRRWRAELEARGEVVRFATLRDLDRETYDFGATLSWRLTPRVQTQLAARALTSTMPSGIAQLDPTVLPLLITRTQSGVLSFAGRLSPTADLVLAVDGTNIRFDAPGFAGGRTGGALLRVSGQPHRTTALAVQADARRAEFDSLGVTTALLEGELAPVLGGVRVRLRAGATATLAAGGEPTRIEPTGTVELSRTLRRWTLQAIGSRSVLPAFGFGRVFRTEVAGVSAQYARLRGATVRLAADASRNVDPFTPELDLSFTSLTAELQQPVGDRLRVLLTAFTRQRVQDVRFANQGVTLSARFDTSR